jgi:DNA-binding beta-propeller fold protein YncE
VQLAPDTADPYDVSNFPAAQYPYAFETFGNDGSTTRGSVATSSSNHSLNDLGTPRTPRRFIPTFRKPAPAAAAPSSAATIIPSSAITTSCAGVLTPVNQLVTPAGTQVELPGMRPNALALSPDGKMLVTAGLTHELIVVDPATGKFRSVPVSGGQGAEEKPVVEGILNPDEKAQLSFTGLAFSPDGSRIYLSNVNGDIKVFGVGADQKVSPLFSIALPPANAD